MDYIHFTGRFDFSYSTFPENKSAGIQGPANSAHLGFFETPLSSPAKVFLLPRATSVI